MPDAVAVIVSVPKVFVAVASPVESIQETVLESLHVKTTPETPFPLPSLAMAVNCCWYGDEIMLGLGGLTSIETKVIPVESLLLPHPSITMVNRGAINRLKITMFIFNLLAVF